jgi:hypothetical protein
VDAAARAGKATPCSPSCSVGRLLGRLRDGIDDKAGGGLEREWNTAVALRAPRAEAGAADPIRRLARPNRILGHLRGPGIPHPRRVVGPGQHHVGARCRGAEGRSASLVAVRTIGPLQPRVDA